MRFPLFIISLLATSFCYAQSGYKLQFKIEGLKDTTAYLGFYFRDGTFIKDTARVSNKGELTFEKAKPLKHGVYFLVLNNSKLFEFVVGEHQQFTLVTKMSDYLKNMKVTGDADNKLFFETKTFEADRFKEAEPFLKILKDTASNESQKKNAREGFAKVRDKVLAYQKDIVKKHPRTVTATLLKIDQPVNIPAPPVKEDGRIDSSFQLRWYREHFFDNFDLSNEALLHMPHPVFTEKINEFLDKLFIPQADTITKAVYYLIDKAKNNQETYRWAVWTCLTKYQMHEIMGLDEVYVNLYDRYFATGEMDFWTSEKLRMNVKDYADQLRKSLIGRLGDNLIMQDANLKPRSLYDIKNKYTILYIFNPDCGSCKTETPKLVNFYNKKKFDVEVYAVSTDTSMAKMKKYIKDMNMNWITVNGPRTYVGSYADHYDAAMTPTLYVLDEKKKIIAKKLPTERLEDFLTQYERAQRITR